MSEPTGGTPPPQQPGNWQTPSSSQGGFQAAPIEAGPAPGVAYADLVTRVVAYIIDAIIYGVALAVVFLIVGGILLAVGGLVGALLALVVVSVLALFGSAIYFVYTWTTMRASLGQKVLGLETVRAADGATLTRDQAIRRWAFLFGPFVLASVLQQVLGTSNIIGLLLSIATFAYLVYLLYTTSQSPKRQGYHDVQAGTVVIKRTR
jgi:uncharacterized RDD family membrane protein YckC